MRFGSLRRWPRGDEAFLWEREHGMRNLREVLVAAGEPELER